MGFDNLYNNKFGTAPELQTSSQSQQTQGLELDIKTKSLVSMLADGKKELGKVSDTFYKIPVPIGEETEIWEFSSELERNITVDNFRDHVINISDSICKWNTASAIYGEIISAKELANAVWQSRQMYLIRTNNVENKKLTESALKEVFMVQNYVDYVNRNMELINLRAMKDLIDNAILKSLFEKSKQLITLGAQLRQEYTGAPIIRG